MPGHPHRSRLPRRVWIGLVVVLVVSTGGSVALVRHVEERAWREVNAAFAAGEDEYRDFYANDSLLRVIDTYGDSPERKARIAANPEEILDWARQMALREDEDNAEEERGLLRWRRTRVYDLRGLPASGGMKDFDVLTLVAERQGLGTSIRVEARLIEKDSTDPRWADALRRIFEGSNVEFKVVSWR